MKRRGLTDHRIEQERKARSLQIRKLLPEAFGNFIAGLATWDWFINPFTFRNSGSRLEPKTVAESVRKGNVVRYEPDPRIADWCPASRSRLVPGPPVQAAALARIMAFFADLQRAAGNPIGWVLGEEFGQIGGRYHCHSLVTGVSHLRRDHWWEEAHRRFGRTKIAQFEPQKAAAFYTAKYAAKQLGGLHFGGTLAGIDLEKSTAPIHEPRRGIIVARSATLPRALFHMTYPRRHR